MDHDLFLRACRCEPVERPPLWIMRQAGRYLPEYREVRSKVDFVTLCKTPDLAAKVTLQPIDRFGFDAAILFSDILVLAEPMGFEIAFNPGPQLGDPARDAARIERIPDADPREALGYVYEAIEILRRELAGRAPLIGFAAAPFTLGAYLVEGGGSKNFDHVKGLLYSDPKTAHRLLEKIARATEAHLSGQVAAGAQAIQLFDTWAGLLDPSLYREFALRHVRPVISAIRALGVPVIYFALNAGHLMEPLADSGADVLGVDWRTPLDRADDRLGGRFCLQGNLDPCVLFAPPAEVRRQTETVLDAAHGLRGHVFNLGHGILPRTPIAAVETVVETVRAHRFVMSSPLRVVVVGAGVSGLCAAFEILDRSERFPWELELACIDRAQHAGGHIRSVRDGGFLCEWGPTGFLDNVPATLTLVRRLSLEAKLMPARDDARTRFLYRRGALQKLPASPIDFMRSGILSPWGKLRVLGEALVRKRPAGGDESVHDFAARRIGREAAETLIDAMVGGIWAGDTRQLSLKAAFPKMAEMERLHGGLFRAMLAGRKRKREETEEGGRGSAFGPGGTLTSFRGGMQALTDALAAALGPRLKLNTTVNAVSDLGRRGFRVHLDEGAPLEADAVVLATPSFVSAGLVRDMDSGIAASLESIPYAGVSVVHLGFAHETLDSGPQGFGFLAPRGEGLRILGSLWPSDIFSGRAPSGLRLTTTMIGGAHDEEALGLSDSKLIGIALDELRRAMGLVVAPRFKRVVRHPRAIPQYTLGHLDRVATIEQALAERPGLEIGGNALHGISVNACIEEAGPLAERVLDVLDGRAASRELSETR